MEQEKQEQKEQKVLHLDSEYRNRWEKFYLIDNTIEDSRQKNWRDVSWNNVIKIVVHILDNIHEVDNSGNGFLAFMNFRWGGQEPIYKKKKFIGYRPIKIWTIGWTNGRTCFLKDICFFTGELIKEYTVSINQFRSHIHPDIEVDGWNLEKENNQRDHTDLSGEFNE